MPFSDAASVRRQRFSAQDLGPAARLSGTRDRAARIVRATLQNATWLRWATLGNLLSLLAEAAPDEFLAAVSTDLKKKRPELAKVLADDGEDHPLMSRCKHAGLLWALECLAWSPETASKGLHGSRQT